MPRSRKAIVAVSSSSLRDGGLPGARAKTKSLTRLAKEAETLRQKRRDIVRGLPSETRRAFNNATREAGAVPDDGEAPAYENYELAAEMEWEDDAVVPDISHDGGERADSLHAAFEQYIIPRRICGARRRWARSRHARLKAMYQEWDRQMPALVQVYLLWKHPRAAPPMEDLEENGEARHEFEVLAINTYGVWPLIIVNPDYRAIFQIVNGDARYLNGRMSCLTRL